MKEYMVLAVACEHYRYKWFSTAQIIDHLSHVNRGRDSSMVTHALLRCTKKGLLKSKQLDRKPYRRQHRFKTTRQGRAIGNWALAHGGEFDEDVMLYVGTATPRIEEEAPTITDFKVNIEEKKKHGN
jgi:hypothetical protein